MTILSKPIQTKKAMSDLANTESTRSSGRANTEQRYLFMVVDKQRFLDALASLDSKLSVTE